LGAVVVAVEPQTACAKFLLSVFRDKASVHLVRKALGASVGQAEMLISNAHAISSLSPDWVRTVTESGRFGECEWSRKETVSIDTLDNLIAQFGRPTFIKIDVEGFEEQVVSGLSTPVGTLSMEFTPEFIESALKCVAHLCRIGNVRFQISLGESMKFALPAWVAADEISGILSDFSSPEFGDLYARFNDDPLHPTASRLAFV
jgi:FkbM family methyltransferase